MAIELPSLLAPTGRLQKLTAPVGLKVSVLPARRAALRSAALGFFAARRDRHLADQALDPPFLALPVLVVLAVHGLHLRPLDGLPPSCKKEHARMRSFDQVPSCRKCSNTLANHERMNSSVPVFRALPHSYLPVDFKALCGSNRRPKTPQNPTRFQDRLRSTKR